MQILAVRPYPQGAHIMVVPAPVSHKHSRPLACVYVKCSGVYIIASACVKTQRTPRRARKNIAADRVANNFIILIPAPPGIIVYQHHIADNTVSAEYKLAKTQYS
jgi:hypothetical protein